MTQDKLGYFEARTAKLQQHRNELQARVHKTKQIEDMKRLVELQEEIEVVRFEVFFADM